MTALSPADIEAKLLQAVHTEGSIADSADFGKSIGITDHNVIVGVIKSLESYDMLLTEVCDISSKKAS
jgi:PheRS DNA binding domain 1